MNQLEGILNINIDSLSIIQGYALGIIILTLVILSNLSSGVIFLLNNYYLDRFKIAERYPRFYKYLSRYRKMSFYYAMYSLAIIIICCFIMIIFSRLFLW